MGWADQYIEQLNIKGSIEFRPRGNSMYPGIKSGQLVRVMAYREDLTDEAKVGDIVLCRVNGKQFLHLVGGFSSTQGYRIQNIRGRVNGWTKQIYGIVTEIEGKACR